MSPPQETSMTSTQTHPAPYRILAEARDARVAAYPLPTHPPREVRIAFLWDASRDLRLTLLADAAYFIVVDVWITSTAHGLEIQQVLARAAPLATHDRWSINQPRVV